MSVLTYAPDKVMFTVCDYRITGITDIRVTSPVPAFKVVRGIGGVNTRVYNPDTSLTIKVELLQTSMCNDVLSELLFNDRLKNNVRLSVILKDLRGGSAVQSSNAFITQTPDFGYSDELETRSWTIECLDVLITDLKGNAKDLPDLLGNTIDRVGDFVGGLFS